MSTRYFYIPYTTADGKNTGSKARDDVNALIRKLPYPFEPACSPVRVTKNFADLKKKRKILKELKKNLKGKEGSVLFAQFPVNLEDVFLYPYTFARFTKKFKTVYIVHDLDALRFASPWLNLPTKKCLKYAWRIVSSNKTMSRYLTEKFGIPPEKIVPLGIFDYLVPKANKKIRAKGNGLVLAGNLTKSLPLIDDYEKKGIKLPLHLYGYLGKREDLKETEQVTYGGCFKGDEVHNHLCGSFGLVWDGDSVSSLHGALGEYQKINSPHKASQYLVAGLPLVVSKDAAIAPYVLENGIGIAVNSLDELPALLSGITDEEYGKMQENVFALQDGLVSGKNFLSAMEKVLKETKNG